MKNHIKSTAVLTAVLCLFATPMVAHAGGVISSLASTAAHSAAASAAGTGAAMATAHEMNKRQENADSSPTPVCSKLLVTHSVAKQVAPLVGQAASHIVVRVSNEAVDPDGTRQCIGTVTFPGGKRNVSWTAQKHGLLYKVAATLTH